jgi:probable F420-dependent oxidoreductase
MRAEAVLGLWQDRPPEEALLTAVVAEETGFRRLWIGEMATYDAFALASEVAHRTTRIEPVVGPLAVDVRTPATIAMGVASVSSLAGRPVHVALGTSSAVVVERWHGRRRTRDTSTLDRTALAVRVLLSGDRHPESGFRLRLPTVAPRIHVAAFGPKAIDVAARRADCMVVNMVTVPAATTFRAALDEAGGGAVELAAWLVTAVDPTPADLAQIRRAVVGYLAVPGYADMFRQAGHGDLVDLAAAGAHPQDVLSAIPDGFERTVGLVGSRAEVAELWDGYRSAGLDIACAVPVTASGDAGRRALRAIAELSAASAGG